MKVARYIGGGEVAIFDEPAPACPDGGLLVRAEACGLCSGELMSWYMDQKIPHVLGHEVAGTVVESKTPAFPIGARVFPHHHAPCLGCDECRRGRFVHCAQWRRTRLTPGGMAELFAVGAENLTDTIDVSDMRASDAALIEPLACVVKSLDLARVIHRGSPRVGGEPPFESALQSDELLGPAGVRLDDRVAVVGLGVMGVMHALLNPGSVAYEIKQDRRAGARKLGIDARGLDQTEPADVVFVCPGSQAAFDFAVGFAAPGATIVMFAPLPPDESLQVPPTAYFRDLTIRHSYSCGPKETRAAYELIRHGRLHAEQVVGEFVGIEELPAAYQRMKRGEILKAMVIFG